MFATLVVVAAISGFIGYSNLKINQQYSSLIIANIEALSEDEPGGYEYPTGKENSFECGATIGEIWGFTKTCSFTVITCPGGGSGCNTRPCSEHG